MERKSKRSIQLVAIGSLFLAIFTSAPSVAAEDIQPSNLKLSSFVAPGGGVGLRSYLGEWILSVEVPDNPQYLLLKFMDVDGKMAATIQTAAQTQAQVVTDITESSLALKLRYSANFGETESAMVLMRDGDENGNRWSSFGGLTSNTRTNCSGDSSRLAVTKAKRRPSWEKVDPWE